MKMSFRNDTKLRLRQRELQIVTAKCTRHFAFSLSFYSFLFFQLVRQYNATQIARLIQKNLIFPNARTEHVAGFGVQNAKAKPVRISC